ncbi:MAG: response regulator [Flavobacteriales bacterium]|nr:response regulator [Crocinitomicaceae bacterium]NBX81004.1 response regulator [Flavobacteriales bacterium]NCA20449.1 response regulator [Crocinitomicaceae bacterium]
MIKAILIDDIEQARITLKRDLHEYAPEIEVIGEASGVVEGAKLLRKVQPDIVFLDIQMQDGSGFDLLDVLPEIPFKIIFITASDAHAIKAFRYAAIDYLLKPVDPDELTQALARFKEQQTDEQAKYKLLNDSLKNHHKPSERLALHSQDKIHIVSIAEIVRCESSVNYTIFYFADNKEMVVTKTLKEFEDLLSEQKFFRVHHSHLVNARYIREFVKSEGGHLIMNNGAMVPVSTRKRAEVIKMLDEL